MSDEVERVLNASIFVDGKTNKNPCPNAPDGKCPMCGSGLESGYGYAGGYGLGGYNYCPCCYSIYNFCEDQD